MKFKKQERIFIRRTTTTQISQLRVENDELLKLFLLVFGQRNTNIKYL